MLGKHTQLWRSISLALVFHFVFCCIVCLTCYESVGRPPASATAPPKGLGMQLGKTQRTNQFLESLKAEGEVILEDVQPGATQSKSSLPLSDPITLNIEERLNVTVKRDGGVSNFDLQGTLSLQILNQEDGFIQLQVLIHFSHTMIYYFI